MLCHLRNQGFINKMCNNKSPDHYDNYYYYHQFYYNEKPHLYISYILYISCHSIK